MSIRLVIVAKELNVGTSTIVEHLQKKGFEVENNPRTKVTEEMYHLLQKDFQSSIAIKEQADQLTIGTRVKKREGDGEVHVEETTVKVEEAPKEKKVETKKEETKKEEPVKEEKPEEKEKEKEVPEVKKVELKKPTVVGKIDLEKVKSKPEKKKKEVKEKVEDKVEEKDEKVTPAKEEEKKKEEEKEEPIAEGTLETDNEFRAETPTLSGLKIKGKISLDKIEKPAKKKKGGKGKDEEGTAKGKGDGAKSENDSASKRRRRKRKKIIKSGSESGSGHSNKDKSNRKSGSDDNQEISQKEIEEKIKATMARITGGGKSKRSKIRREEREKRKEKQDQIDLEQQEAQPLSLTEFVSVSELASLMDVSPTEVITACMNMGIFVSINQRLDAEVIELVAEEFGHVVEFISAEEQLDIEEEDIIDDDEDLLPRSPIVTVMGHVDHGKTSLLDYIRKANVISGEAGGITQHIGAYEVKVGAENRKITFLDTPGHEAFTAMRARGAKVTDVAVIIVAADDNVMPQTKEAISHAQAAGVPIIFAINKVDKENAQPEKIKQELAAMNFLVEDWGGKYQSQDISAKTGHGVDELLEKIILESDILELTANPDRLASGVVLEASLDKGRGYIAKFLVQTGTLKIGDALVAGAHYGKIKAMYNERGKRSKEAGPSAPVLVLGMKGAPQAGEKFKVMENEQEARQLAAKRGQIVNEQARRAQKRLSLEDIGRRLALGSFKELNLIVKGDVDGSVEALTDSLEKLTTKTVQVNIVHKAVGGIIESDVLLASASDAIIVGFQVRPSASARTLAEREGVQIKTYSVIYTAIDQIKSAIEGMLEPTMEEKVTCSVEIREVYKISKVGTVAGCYVQEGKISRNTKIRVVRDGIVVYPIKEGTIGEISSLKRFKEDVKEVKNGTECGITIENFNDIKVGDIIEGYDIVEVKQKL